MHRVRTRMVLVALVVLGVGGGVQREMGLAVGEGQLARGQWRRAAQTFREILDARPRTPRAQLGLARALSHMSGCAEALVLLDGLRHKYVWTADAAVAEGLCHMQQGDGHAAIAAYEEAVQLRPDNTVAWMALAQARAWIGDRAGAEDAIDGLLACQGGPGLEALVRTEIALRDGDPAFDSWLFEARSAIGNTSALGIHDARRWLDLDDPLQAARVIDRHLRMQLGGAQLSFWQAESLRRLGSTVEAEGVFHRRTLVWAVDDALALVIRARVWVDLGLVDDAAAMVDRFPDPTAAEALATRWYVARARGHDAEADRLRAIWERTDKAMDRRLEQLIPLQAPNGVGIPDWLDTEEP